MVRRAIFCEGKSDREFLEALIKHLKFDPAEVSFYVLKSNCVERFLECSQFKGKENHKAILNQIYTIAYPDAPYDFEHPYFGTLMARLQDLLHRPAANGIST